MFDLTARAMPLDFAALSLRRAVALLPLLLIPCAAGEDASCAQDPWTPPSAFPDHQREACRDRGQSLFQRGVRHPPRAEVGAADLPQGAPVASAGHEVGGATNVASPVHAAVDLQVAVALAGASGSSSAAESTSSTRDLLHIASGHAALIEDMRLIARELSQEGAFGVLAFVLLTVTIGVVAFLLPRRSLTGDEKPEAPRRPGLARGQDNITTTMGARGNVAAAAQFSAATPLISQRAPSPSPSPATPPHAYQRTASAAEPVTLCADLIVPDGDECTLQLPRLLSRGGPLSVYVDSMKGAPVFRVQVAIQGARRCLTLASPTEEVVFGFCRDVQPNASIPRIAVHDHRMAEFGVLQADPKAAGGFIFRSRKGWAVHFGGSPHIQAQDDQGLLLATTDPMGEPNFVGDGKRPLRIGPEVDAGLIVLCFLGIDLLQTEG